MAEALTRFDGCVALLPWGDVIEDFLDSLQLTLEDFCAGVSGGWMFGYVQALQSEGIRTVLVCFSSRISEPTRLVHAPTGATLWALPSSRAYRRLRRTMTDPYGWTIDDTFADIPARRRVHGLLAPIRDIAPYLNTPMRPVARVLKREGCSAILCQEYEYARFDTCVLLGKLLRIPVFATFQGGTWQTSRLERHVRPRAIRASAGLIVGPRSEAQRITERYGVPPDRIARIFNPIDLSTWYPVDGHEARAALEIPPDARVVVWHGRVDMRRKGLDVLLDAWEGLCRERTDRDLRLLIVGTGRDAAALRDEIESRQLRGVHRVDRYVLERDAMRNFLSAADIFTLPSRHEGFPVAPIEAMACGLPVVAADAPGVPDILEDGEESGGLVIPREDPVALAEGLGRLVDDAELARRLGGRARQRVEHCFSLEAVGRQLRAVLFPERVAPLVIAIVLALAAGACASGGTRGPLPPGTLVGGCGPARGLRPLYDLPFAPGESFELTQGNCGRASHDGRFRYAFDFRMPPGSPVLAARAGRVSNVRDDRLDGTRRVGDENFVIVLHDDGQYSRYIHLQRYSVRVVKGDRVSVGDTVALSGNSGQSLFPHLHFDVAKNCPNRCETIPSAFRNAEPPIPDAREAVRALE